MKRNLSALFLCLLMIASSLAGCMGNDDSTDDSEVAELENEITMQDDKIAELEAEVATLTTQHQDAVAELATVQSTLQSTQTSLDSAEANATIHQTEISSLEAERDMAQAEINMLYELMSNMSDQSNETFESMALQIAELNQHMSNLSSMLNESYDRHQENATLVSQLTAERDNLQVALEQANNTIAGYLQDAVDVQALAELQSHVAGIIRATALDPKTNGDPQVTITNNGLSTQFTYTSNISDQHTIYIEFCNTTILGHWGVEAFDFATGEDWSLKNGGWGDTVHNYAYRVDYIDQAGVASYPCTILQTVVSSNQFNATLTYPNLDLFNNSIFTGGDLWISVCRVGDCPLSNDWYMPQGGFAVGVLQPHFFTMGDVIPVKINGELPCTLGFITDAGGSCQQPPACTDRMLNVVSGIYSSDCQTVLIDDQDYETTNHTLPNASLIFFEGGGYGDSTIYVCDTNADAYFDVSQYGTLDVYILGLGTSNEHHVSWAIGSNSNEGSITTSTGGSFHWDLSQYSDISFLDWTDPDGVC